AVIEFIGYYQQARPHQGVGQRPPSRGRRTWLPDAGFRNLMMWRWPLLARRLPWRRPAREADLRELLSSEAMAIRWAASPLSSSACPGGRKPASCWQP